jgi:hypothetical protein
VEWDWNVWIADFGPSTSPDHPKVHSLVGLHKHSDFHSIDSHYLAPECYENRYPPASGVFSFGLIVYELLSRQLAFAKELTSIQIGYAVVVDDERPMIPVFVLPSAKTLITDCWETNPDDRPSLDEIVDRLAERRWKVTANVNSAKLAEFVRKIETFEVGTEERLQ